MSDMIFREDAINALEKLSACEEYGVEIGTDEETYIGKYEAITVISDLPSADRPQLDKDVVEPIGNGNVIMSEDTYEELLIDRPQGEWIVKNGVFYCSCCGNDSAGLSEDDVNVYEVPLPNYCQDCGARMKGADDD